MPGLSRTSSVWLPVAVILIAMLSIQSGASLAKSLFPLVGAPGVTALRIVLGTAILVAIFKPWRLRFKKSNVSPAVLWSVPWGDELYVLPLHPDHPPRDRRRAGVYRSAGGGTFSSRRPVDFIWVVLAVLGLWFLLPLGQNVTEIDLTGAALALGAGACWAVYILTGQRAGEEHGPATVALGSVIAAIVFVPIGMAQATASIWQWSVMPIGLAVAVLSTALPYSLEMIALTRLPTRIFGTLMSMEPALAAISGMVFLGETLTFTQTLALCSIIAASMGSTLTMRPEPKVEKIDIN